MMHFQMLRRSQIARAVLLGAAVFFGSSHSDRPNVQQTASLRIDPALQEAAPDSVRSASAPVSLRDRANHLAQLGVNRWLASGYQGKGVKIAILDSGFRGYRAFLGNALPERVISKSFRQDHNLEAKDSQHGILCGEVVHTLAPQTELLFANWEPDEPAQFLEAVRWARSQGARIISCSVIMPSWSDGEGGGPVNQALSRILDKGDDATGVLCFACAGNTADRHWSGLFHPGRDGCHEWSPGQISNAVTPWGNDSVSVELYGSQAANYELRVFDAVTHAAVGAAPKEYPLTPARQVVRFEPRSEREYRVQVRLRHGRTGQFHLVVLGGGLAYSNARGSIAFPADCSRVLAVGAVNKDGQRASYSSCGPNSRQPKPELVAPVPFPSSWRARPFSGTSAAAPQGAALAALLWSRHMEWTADQVRTALRNAAIDLGPPGHDWETGYGRVSLPSQQLPTPALPLHFALFP
jgi:subtilisin family serine protease